MITNKLTATSHGYANEVKSPVPTTWQDGNITAWVQYLPRSLLAPLPLFTLQPLLQRIVLHIIRQRPELFARLGVHAKKLFLIDPLNLPFVFLLQPDSLRPRLRARRRDDPVAPDARIAGTFLTLLDLVDGRLDGDALFFSRDLVVEGDTEAVVCLRNALDDLEGSIADDIAAYFGLPGCVALSILRRIRRRRP